MVACKLADRRADGRADETGRKGEAGQGPPIKESNTKQRQIRKGNIIPRHKSDRRTPEERLTGSTRTDEAEREEGVEEEK